jgi:hypothetical protein
LLRGGSDGMGAGLCVCYLISSFLILVSHDWGLGMDIEPDQDAIIMFAYLVVWRTRGEQGPVSSAKGNQPAGKHHVTRPFVHRRWLRPARRALFHDLESFRRYRWRPRSLTVPLVRNFAKFK